MYNSTSTNQTAVPLIQYHGGNTTATPEVNLLYLGDSFKNDDASFATELTNRTSRFVQGEAMSNLREYDIGLGNNKEPSFLPSHGGSTIDTNDLPKILTNAIQSGLCAPPNKNSIYSFIIDKNTPLTQKGKLYQACAYHDNVDGIPFTVTPLAQCTMMNLESAQPFPLIDTTTGTLFHELREAATNSNPGAALQLLSQTGWNGDLTTDGGAEIVDLCARIAQEYPEGWMQPSYSNEAGGCVVNSAYNITNVEFVTNPLQNWDGNSTAKNAEIGVPTAVGGLALLAVANHFLGNPIKKLIKAINTGVQSVDNSATSRRSTQDPLAAAEEGRGISLRPQQAEESPVSANTTHDQSPLENDQNRTTSAMETIVSSEIPKHVKSADISDQSPLRAPEQKSVRHVDPILRTPSKGSSSKNIDSSTREKPRGTDTRGGVYR